MFKFNIVLLICGLAFATASFNYEGYKIYETIPRQESESDLLNNIAEQTEEIDFLSLTKIPNVPARALVSPKYQEVFENTLIQNGMEFSVVNSNVSKSITEEKMLNNFMRSWSRKIGFTKYHRFGEINNYLDDLVKTYSSRVSVKVVGKSYEGRDIKTITITNGDGRTDKKVLFIDAGIHAREWIAPATALYLINQLTENYEKHENLLKDFDWVILPVVNPDGYEYTHTNSRFWRKTRQPSGMCSGTDGNRNFDFHWGETGASSSPCSDTFKGPKPFSEPETQIVRDIMHSFAGKECLYLTLHSYGNYLLYPWGYTSALPENWESIDEVATAGANAVKAATGSRYTVGSSTNVLYAAAGGSDDYALAKANIPFSITMELPAGGSGFDPKPSQIQKLVEESLICIKAMVLKIHEKYLNL